MLVYAPGQFFAPHQDSEKTDDMIGTLVVSHRIVLTYNLSIEGKATAVDARNPHHNVTAGPPLQ
jgi:hypothetical protein